MYYVPFLYDIIWQHRIQPGKIFYVPTYGATSPVGAGVPAGAKIEPTGTEAGRYRYLKSSQIDSRSNGEQRKKNH